MITPQGNFAKTYKRCVKVARKDRLKSRLSNYCHYSKNKRVKEGKSDIKKEVRMNISGRNLPG